MKANEQQLSERFHVCAARLSARNAEHCFLHGHQTACTRCSFDQRSAPTAKENGRSVHFRTNCQKMLLLRRLDGCIFPSTPPRESKRRCDYIALEDETKACWLIELKGSSYADACDQLEQSCRRLDGCELWRGIQKLSFVVALSSGKYATTKVTERSSSIRRLESLIKSLKARNIDAKIVKQELRVEIALCP
jgi:hypothetical protein